jgi:hypothetical protein
MKDHIPFLTPLKASDQSRNTEELEFEQTVKPSILHSGHVLCPRQTHRSLLDQQGQQELLDRGFKQPWPYATDYLYFAES